jgi:transcriptional regulator with XRE-family HTH domain
MACKRFRRRVLHRSLPPCNSRCMSEQPDEVSVPAWDVADRMRKSLRHADVGVADMGAYLGVARNTVSTWINGKIIPGKQTLRLWALRTGVPYEWLAGDLDFRRPHVRKGSTKTGLMRATRAITLELAA